MASKSRKPRLFMIRVTGRTKPSALYFFHTDADRTFSHLREGSVTEVVLELAQQLPCFTVFPTSFSVGGQPSFLGL